ncbi:high affinity copper uptake 1-like [Brachionus plicatilis]|uniref:Copper transport protein n=1 Tax=Brachionus plicatilis TaxID=10195 RepID=A0A3M7R992_BRAPC|nr:high affinity copper uptake 1-like [Brachionus plicatilis]
MAYSTELIKMFQKVLNKKVQSNWSHSSDHGETTPLVSSLRIPSESEIKKRKIQNHVIQSLMYMLNLTIGYFLMLIAMGMYSGHFLAIVLGIGFGYYFLHILTPDFYESISNKSIGINEDEHLPRSSNYDQI